MSAILCELPLDMDEYNDDLLCMLFEEQMAFVKKNMELIKAFMVAVREQDPNGNIDYYVNLDDNFVCQLGFAIDLVAYDYDFKGLLYELMQLIHENRGLFNELYHAAAAAAKK
jgi:hypothetical protein